MKELFKKNRQRGMSYVELIVVLSIFSILSSVVIYNYGDFQSRVDVKNLSSDIGLKIVEAQKSSLSGLFPPLSQRSQILSDWKPSFGVYFNLANQAGPNLDNKSFIYFTDLNSQNELFDTSTCPGSGECLEKIIITKGSSVSNLAVCYQGNTDPCPMNNLSDLTVTFSRPDSGAILSSMGSRLINVAYVQITIISLKSFTSTINIYPSGRIQIN
jgi:prepilin-type N-terminal cleavage/methylation domain-containing protein